MTRVPSTRGTRAEIKLGLLRAADLFHGLSEEHMRRVDEMTVMVQCERGRILYTPGQTGEALFLLKRGKVDIYRLSPDGKKLVTAVVGQGTLFGDMVFTGHTMLDSFAEAVEDSILCVMSRHDVEELIRQYPSVGIRLLDTLAHRVRELEARLEESALRNMQSRVASALLRLRERQGMDRITVTHQELGEIVGTYRETVTRTLGELRDMGLISLERRCIHIADVVGLRTLVGSEFGQG
jgi:CRP-like cAMP-binding protein